MYAPPHRNSGYRRKEFFYISYLNWIPQKMSPSFIRARKQFKPRILHFLFINPCKTSAVQKKGIQIGIFFKNSTYLPFLLLDSCLTVLHPVVFSGSNFLEWKCKLGCWTQEYSKDFPKIASVLKGSVIT